MRTGRYTEAWRLEADSIAARDPARRDDPALPYHLRWVWDGRAIDGRDVLVRCYHGLGDTIQFARYLPALAARARSVTMEVQPRLAPLLAGCGADLIVPFDVAHPLPPAECDIEITELPCALRIAPEALAPPYLASRPAPLPPGTIGLCHTAGDWDADRSIPERAFAAICAAHPSITLVPQPSALAVRNPQGCPFDMAETAALVAGCDLIVTVDTMIAHLAGAIGRPVWLLLKAEPDWRWDPARSDTPWYPTMRLYAQSVPGDWDSVIAAVEADLATLSLHRSPAAWPA